MAIAAARTLATQQQPTTTTETTTPAPSNNRLDEHDADYRRLHTATLARLESSIRTYVRELRASGGDAHRTASAASRFIQRHTTLLRDAYHAGWREGQRDYYGEVSAARDPHDTTAPSDEQAGRRLAFYAPSVAKMAAEGLRAYHESLTARFASERATDTVLLAGPSDNALTQWQDGLSNRLTLQAEVIWPALHDGYATAGASDPAAPFSHLWWELGPVKTDHCPDCPWMAYNSPYDPPGSGGNELAQTPGDGRTECGAACKCSLRYGDWMLPEDTDWAQYYFPPDAPVRNQPANPGLFPETVKPWQTPVPVAIDRAGNYVYPNTPEEARLQAERAARLRVEPIPLDQTELTASQKAALDDFRSAWRKWDRVRGDRPAARSLFGYVWNEHQQAFQVSQSAATLVPRSSGFQIQDEAFARSWADLTPGQQRALVALWYAIAAWDAAVTVVVTPQTQLAEIPTGASSSPVVALYDPSQARDKRGRFEDEGAPSKSEHLATARDRMLARSHEELAARVAEHQHITTVRLPHVEREITRYRGWLDTHEAKHPQYGEVAKYHEKLLVTHAGLTARAASLAEEIGMREHAATHQREIKSPNDALTEAGREVLAINGRIATARRHLAAERDPVRRAQMQTELDGLVEQRRAASARAQPAAIERQRAANRRWGKEFRATNGDIVRERDRSRYERLKADPEKLAAKRARSIEAVRRQRERQRAEKQQQQQQQQPGGLTERRDQQMAVALMGGHEQGYEQARKPNGQWDATGNTGGGESRYTVENSSPRYREMIHERIGRAISDEELGRLVGAQHGDHIRVGGGMIAVRSADGKRLHQVAINEGDNGRGPELHNWGMWDTSSGADVPMEMDALALARQAHEAQRLGFSHITTQARPDTRDFEALPHLGYNATIAEALHESKLTAYRVNGQMVWPEAKPVPRAAAGARALRELLSTPEGAQWWHEHGLNPGLMLDVRHGSEDMAVLDAYLREHHGHGLEAV